MPRTVRYRTTTCVELIEEKNSTATRASSMAFQTVRPKRGNCSFSSKSLAVEAGLTCGMWFTPVKIASGSETELR